MLDYYIWKRAYKYLKGWIQKKIKLCMSNNYHYSFLRQHCCIFFMSIRAQTETVKKSPYVEKCIFIFISFMAPTETVW